jgi:hypothetical protein
MRGVERNKDFPDNLSNPAHDVRYMEKGFFETIFKCEGRSWQSTVGCSNQSEHGFGTKRN